MSDYTVSIQQNSPVWNLYQKLKADGVKDKDIDKGYPVTDYVKKTRKTAHQNDHVIDATEVLNYALENYERYQLAIKETTSFPVPWSLDDLNPATNFDANIREQVGQAITAFKKILTAKGLKEGTPRYNELMALSLFSLTCPFGYRNRSMPDDLRQELNKEGLKEVITYQILKGSFAALPNMFGAAPCEYEETALGSLAKDCQLTAGPSKALYAVFRAAGLKPQPMFVIPSYKVETANVSIHMAIGISLGGKTRLFDPALRSTDAGPVFRKDRSYWSFALTGSEFLADHFSNLGVQYDNKGEAGPAIAALTTAIELDPRSEAAHINLGTVYSRNAGTVEGGIGEFETALKLNPNSDPTHFDLGLVYLQKKELDRGIAELKTALKIDPKFAEAHAALGDCYREKGFKAEDKNDWAGALRMLQNAVKEWGIAKTMGVSSPSQVEGVWRMRRVLATRAEQGHVREDKRACEQYKKVSGDNNFSCQ